MSNKEMETTTELSDAELFADVMNNEAEETVANDPADDARPRDEHGRFASKQPETKPDATTEDQPPPQAEPHQEKTGDGMVPSWRLREIREAREAAQREADRERQERTRLEAELNAARFQMQQWQQRQSQEGREAPDPLADPVGYDRHIMSMLETRQKELEANFSFRLAHDRHGEVFEKAYSDLLSRTQRGDLALRNHILASGDPGATLVAWYKREQTIAKVGDDPDAYRNKVLDDALNDEAFLARAAEKIRGNPSQSQGGRTMTKLPPSLNRTTGSPVSAGNDDMDDNTFFHSIMQR